MNESRHKFKRVIPHIWMSHVINLNESCHTYEWVTSQIWMSHVTHTNESRHKFEWVMSHIWMSHITNSNEVYNTYERVTSLIFTKKQKKKVRDCCGNDSSVEDGECTGSIARPRSAHARWIYVSDVQEIWIWKSSSTHVSNTFEFLVCYIRPENVQHTATHCNTMQKKCSALQCTATETHCSIMQHIVTHFNTLQQSAIICNKLQQTVTLLWFSASYSRVQQWSIWKLTHQKLTAKAYYNILEHNATHCNTL